MLRNPFRVPEFLHQIDRLKSKASTHACALITWSNASEMKSLSFRLRLQCHVLVTTRQHMCHRSCVTVAPALKPLLILGELGKAWREVQKNLRRNLLDLVASSNKTVSTPETGSFNPIFLCFKPPNCVLQFPKLFVSTPNCVFQPPNYLF